MKKDRNIKLRPHLHSTGWQITGFYCSTKPNLLALHLTLVGPGIGAVFKIGIGIELALKRKKTILLISIGKISHACSKTLTLTPTPHDCSSSANDDLAELISAGAAPKNRVCPGIQPCLGAGG
jgi:hypothetical protein